MAATLTWGTPPARWLLASTVLGAALTFVDATVVNLALPHIGRELDAGAEALTWVVNAYALTLAAFVLLGGALGDRIGHRRVYLLGIAGFTAASVVCGLAPDPTVLIAARAAQGVAAALLTPGSLALLQASFAPSDRSRAIGAWSGLTGVAGALGPFLGGWLIATADWRWAFLINVPLGLFVILATRRHVVPPPPQASSAHLEWTGALLLVSSLAALSYGLTAWSGAPLASPEVAGALLAACLLGVGLVVRERRSAHPLVTPELYGSRTFVASNVVTFLFYAALGIVFFTLGITLQVGAGMSPVAAGLALLPATILMLLFSGQAGVLMDRVGSRIPMTVGPVIAAVGVALLTRLEAEVTFWLDVLVPTTVLGVGLTLLVTPLTATVLAAAPASSVGLASGVNNAVARTAGLLAVAMVPVIGDLGGRGLVDPERVLEGSRSVMWTAAALMVTAAVVSVSAVPSRVREEAAPSAPRPERHHCSPAAPPLVDVGAPADGQRG